MSFWKKIRSMYAGFVGSHGYGPFNPNVVERASGTTWFKSSNGNYCRFCESRDIRTTVCLSKNNNIGIVYVCSDDSEWIGPFNDVEDAMDYADKHIF